MVNDARSQPMQTQKQQKRRQGHCCSLRHPSTACKNARQLHEGLRGRRAHDISVGKLGKAGVCGMLRPFTLFVAGAVK